MKTREELQASMEAGLASGEKKIKEMKASIAKAGDDATEGSKEALAEAEKMWDSGRSKLDELTAASDEQFEKLRASAAENWDSISDSMESGWNTVSDKFKSFFS